MEKGRKEKRNSRRALKLKEDTRVKRGNFGAHAKSTFGQLADLWDLHMHEKKTYVQLTSLTKCYQFYVLLNLEVRGDRNQQSSF